MKISWGWRIAIVYTFFAVSTASFVAFAMTERVELVRDDYYEQSLKHDQTFASEQRGESVAGGVIITQHDAKLEIELPHAVIASGTASFYRPENSQLDRAYKLAGQRTQLPLDKVQKGSYQVTIEWTFEGKPYRVVREITVGGAS